MRGGQSLAVCAGVCAAAASVCAKLAMESTTLDKCCHSGLWIVEQWISNSNMTESASASSLSSSYCPMILTVLRVLCFGGMFILNSLMWTLYVKSLQHCQSSVSATVTNTASNFFFTAVCGWLIFSERLPALWWIGTALMLIGLVIIHSSSAASSSTSSSSSSSSSIPDRNNKPKIS